MRRESGDGWEMILCDFRDAIGNLQCHAVITDPPYLGASTEGNQSGLAAAVGRGSAVPRAYRGGRGMHTMMQYKEASESDLSSLCDLSHRTGAMFLIVFNDFPGLMHLWSSANNAGWKASKQPVVWVRGKSLPTGFMWRPGKDCEFVMVAARTNNKRELPCAGSLPGHYKCSPPLERGQLVVGQKPVNLMRAIVRDYTHESMIVLDPFAGSGTTGVAALQEGRRFIGCESDPGRFEMACKRLSAPVPMRLFA